MLQRKILGWVPISSSELYRNVVGLARALESWGIRKGDRVAILAENRPEWTMTDFAVLSLGAVSVPHILDSDCRTNCLHSQRQRRAGHRRFHSSAIGKSADDPAAHARGANCRDGFSRDGARDPGAASDAEGPDSTRFRLRHSRTLDSPDDLATIIYTSGTTGTSKGAMLTHGNMASNIACSLDGFGLASDEVSISFLPLSHVTARHVDFALLYRGVALAYCPDMAKLEQTLTEIQPVIFVGVPRVYEKIRRQVIIKTAHFPKSAIYRWALSVGRSHRNKR